MNKEIENIVVIDRFDYDELVEKAGATEYEIKRQAEELYMKNNIIPVRIEFNEYLKVIIYDSTPTNLINNHLYPYAT